MGWVQRCGNDYGWSRFEGSRCFDMAADRYGDCDGASRSGYTFPVFEYCHQSYDSTEEGEEVYTDGIDICGSRSVIGNAVIGKGIMVCSVVDTSSLHHAGGVVKALGLVSLTHPASIPCFLSASWPSSSRCLL